MIDEGNDITDEQLEQIIERKSHQKELIRAVKSLRQDGLTDLLKKNSDAVNLFIGKLREISKQEAPKVNVTTNNSEVISSINQMAKDILQSQKDLKQSVDKLIDKKPLEWEFNINRNNFGNIQSITAKPK